VNLVKEGATVELQIPTTETGLEENKKVPQEYGLKQNFPNPFNASTVIEFMPERTGAAELKIYDTAGKNVWTHPLTVHKDVVYRQEIDFSTIPSGSYFYTVAMKDGSTPVRKMMLVK
jgi:hypothetical protein